MSTPEQLPEERESALSEPQPAGISERVFRFEELARRMPEVVIEYRGKRYRLRATRNGGLILNK